MGKQLFVVCAAFFAISILTFPASACHDDRFVLEEYIKISLFNSIIELVSGSEEYETQICSLKIKIERKEIDIKEATYAVFPYLNKYEIAVPIENLNELRALFGTKQLNLSHKLIEWQSYEYSPPDETGLIGLLHNSKTDKIICLIGPPDQR